MQYQQHLTYGQYEVAWKTIPGFTKYEVNDTSNVRNKKTKQVLKPSTIQQVHLSDENNKLHNVRVYRASLMAFFPDIKPSESVDHIDENKIKE